MKKMSESPEVFLESFQTSKMEIFTKLFYENSILDV